MRAWATRFLPLLSLLWAACTPAPHPCRTGAEDPPPSWPAPSAWEHREIPEPAGGWVGSVALSPDGARAVYLDEPGGNYIPVSDLVSVVRIDLGPTENPVLLELPGEALRNFAWLSWGRSGLAWASWSSLGVADPDAEHVTRLWHLPGPRVMDERPAFPMLTSVAWAPGGDCLATVLVSPDDRAELIAWNAAGATGPAHRREVKASESVAAWEGKGCLLLEHREGPGSSARFLDPSSGTTAPAEPPSAGAQAATRLGGKWLEVKADGELVWGGRVVALIPYSLTAKPGQKHVFDRVEVALSGRAIAVDENVSAPKVDLHYLHLLTPR